MRKETEEVFYADSEVVRVSAEDISLLKSEARANVRRRARLCTHNDIEARVHEMLIVHMRDCYVRPHCHPSKTESFHVIEGAADVVIFSDEGTVESVIRMGPAHNLYYRLNQPRYHTVLINSEFFVFHEVTEGPFRKGDSRFASWAPESENAAAASEYVRFLRGAVLKFAG